MEQKHNINEYEQARLEKREKLCELGVDPYGGKFPQAEPLEPIAVKTSP